MPRRRLCRGLEEGDGARADLQTKYTLLSVRSDELAAEPLRSQEGDAQAPPRPRQEAPSRNGNANQYLPGTLGIIYASLGG